MTEAEELELLELEAEAAQADSRPPAAASNVGRGETFLNKAASALPLGKQATNLLTTLGLQGAKSVGVGSPGARLTPQAMAEAQRSGIDVQSPKEAIPGFADTYGGVQGEFEQRTAAGEQQNPIAAGLGTGTGVALSLLAPLPKVTAGGKGAGPLSKAVAKLAGEGGKGRVLANALTAGGYGGINSAANSQGRLLKGEIGQVLSDAAGVGGLKDAYSNAKAGNLGRAALDVMGSGAVGGALTGGALSGGVEGVRASGLPEAMKRFANRKALNSLGAMKPELNRLGSDAAQDLGNYALETGVVSPLASRATMAERIQSAKARTGSKIGDALSELDALASPSERINPIDAANRIDELAEELSKQPALSTIAGKFKGEAANIRKAAGAGASPGGSTLSSFEKDVARPYKQTTNWNADLALPKETLKKLPRALEAEVERAAGAIGERTGRGDLPAKYAAGKRDYGKLAELSDIAEEGVKRQASNRTFGLVDALTGVGAAAAGSGAGPGGSLVLGGLGLAGGKLASRFGDQVSATGAHKLSKLLSGSAAGGQIGKTVGVLDGAASRPAPRLMPALTEKEMRLLEQYAEALKKEQK